MTLTIKMRGSIELVLLLPLFLVMIGITLGTGTVLHLKIILEKNAVTSQNQMTFGQAIHLDTGQTVTSQRHLPKVSSFRLPKTFLLFLAKNPAKTFELSSKNTHQPMFQRYFLADYKKNGEPVEDTLELRTSFRIPGRNLETADWFRTLLWFEAMKDAGFNYHLPCLGWREIREAGLPVTDLGIEVPVVPC